jgi:transcriptional regulator with XRE-family HTH domain
MGLNVGRLREVRERRFVTQAELADRTGIARATLSRLENGEQRPRISTVRKIADALGVQPEDLVDWAAGGDGAETGKAAA